MRTRVADDPFHAKHWRRVGADEGRRNEPREPNGPAPGRSRLETVWLTVLRDERQDFLQELGALNKRWANHHRLVTEIEPKTATDQRQAALLQSLRAKTQSFAGERDLLCDSYLTAVEGVTQRAREADAAWRTGNERHRSRRISLLPAEFVVPEEILAIPPDPFA